MSRLNATDWAVYAAIRTHCSKAEAEKFRHLLNAKKREHGVLSTPTAATRWQIVKDYGMDGHIMKLFLPYHMNRTARSRFEDDHAIVGPTGPYDCTGLPFTQWFSFHSVPNGTWVYHSIGYDV